MTVLGWFDPTLQNLICQNWIYQLGLASLAAFPANWCDLLGLCPLSERNSNQESFKLTSCTFRKPQTNSLWVDCAKATTAFDIQNLRNLEGSTSSAAARVRQHESFPRHQRPSCQYQRVFSYCNPANLDFENLPDKLWEGHNTGVQFRFDNLGSHFIRVQML